MNNKEYTVKHFIKSYDVKEFIDNYVNFPKVSRLCKDCPKYNTNYSCPPFKFNPISFLKEFDMIEITVTQITYTDLMLENYYTPEELEEKLNKTFFYEENITKNSLYEREKNYTQAYSLIGPCNNCGQNCKKHFNKCNHPNKKRYSTESMGIQINKLLEESFNIKLEFLDERIPEYSMDKNISKKKSPLVKNMNSVMGLLYSE